MSIQKFPDDFKLPNDLYFSPVSFWKEKKKKKINISNHHVASNVAAQDRLSFKTLEWTNCSFMDGFSIFNLIYILI